jgi:hypothetical protein
MDKQNGSVLKGRVEPDSFMLFRILLLFSPLFLMFFMLGSAIMSGTPFVFLLYFLLLFLALLCRHFVLWILNANTISSCGNSVYIPFIFGNYKEFMSTFVFVFTICYIFGPFFIWKQANVSSVFILLFLIVYMSYDFVVRASLTSCMKGMSINMESIFTILGNIVLGGFLGGFSQWVIYNLGLSKYLYYSNSVNRPTKNVLKCGKMKS